MGERHTLRRSRRTRRVPDRGEIIRTDRREHWDLGVAAFGEARFEEVFPPEHLAACRGVVAAERDDRHARRELVDAFHHGRRSHEQEFRTAPAQHVVEVFGRRRRVERNADAADEPDRDIYGEVACAVRPDDRDPGPGSDTHPAERRHGGGDLVSNLRRRANGPATVGAEVHEADGQTPTRQSEQDLLVDGAIGTMQEAVACRVLEQGRQVLVPMGNRRTEQFVGVVAPEATTLPEVRLEEPNGASPEPEPDREEDRRRQPDTEVLSRPPTSEGEDVAGGGEAHRWAS